MTMKTCENIRKTRAGEGFPVKAAVTGSQRKRIGEDDDDEGFEPARKEDATAIAASTPKSAVAEAKDQKDPDGENAGPKRRNGAKKED